MIEDYRRARRAGARQVRRDVAEGRYPYPPALDDILRDVGYQGEIPIGAVELDTALIAGTKTRGRQNSFSSSFMPLEDDVSEFARKWSVLVDAMREEGQREPVVAFEFMQRFYVQEGNKRVSVVRFLGTATVTARVTRVVPLLADDDASRAYRAFARFYRVAPVYGIDLPDERAYAELARLVGCDLVDPWPEDRVRDLRSALASFVGAFRRKGGGSLGLGEGCAFLAYARAYGFDAVLGLSPAEADKRVERVWGEFTVASNDEPIAYLEAPGAARASGALGLLDVRRQSTQSRPLRIAFVYDRSPETSGWALLHELARAELEVNSNGSVETASFCDREADEAFDRAIDAAVADGSGLVVTISPKQIQQTLRAAVAHPDIAFLNCSVSLSHSVVKTLSLRMYEVKFLLGALAASVSKNHLVGYVAKSPVFGSVAEINAFALGAAMVDAHARVHLMWLSERDVDWRRGMAEAGVRVVSAREYPHPLAPKDPWGLYVADGEGCERRIAEPVWNWERAYGFVVRALQNEAWYREEAAKRNQALNYWWGMSAGVLDVWVDEGLPRGQRDLVELLRQGVVDGSLEIFSGELRSQEGEIQPAGSPRLSSDAIARMDWLNENVVGSLPAAEWLSRDGVAEVQVSGVIEVPLGIEAER